MLFCASAQATITQVLVLSIVHCSPDDKPPLATILSSLARTSRYPLNRVPAGNFLENCVFLLYATAGPFHTYCQVVALV